MQVIKACDSCIHFLPQPHHRNRIPTQTRRCLGRREFCISSLSSPSEAQHNEDVVLAHSISTPRIGRDHGNDLVEAIQKSSTFITRRTLFTSVFMYSCYHPSRCAHSFLPAVFLLIISSNFGYTAHALGDPSVTIEEVTPPVYPSGGLFPYEERIVKLFEKNTYAVVNIFDVTLRPQLNVTGMVEIPEGNGSGVVWDGQGHIVTNYHVIGNSLSRNPSRGQIVARVNILASEGVQKNFEGTLIGADRAKDLAVLKVEASEELLRPIKVGPSSSLRVGQQCLAIGNPFGFDHTLTVGVVSGLNRDISSRSGVTIGGGIQTDAAINPGNRTNEVVGTSAGVGFAIPSSTVAKIIPQLIQFGKVYRAGLNVDIAPDLVANQLNVRNGALVLQVPGNSLAAKAGILPTTRGFAGNIVLGDIIVAVDNKPVRSKAELDRALDDYNVGDKVLLKIQRGNENLELPLPLEQKDT
ncbi:hypothetical protein RHMOL_Rhmol10G0048800 [Rhododendron molle]|uniref:Uncharacterized protein n=1 Tax=Rhododendron molle TaxID=49168 RepID=A0ACC0M000_RHOML|nr:hypothetical protein RHMOL_Rhmol10G0048800 [Rhododendron molle]